MYSWWASMQPEVESDGSNRSVLQSFPDNVGREVVLSVVRQLANHLSLTATSSRAGSQHLRSPLDTEKEVLWTMEVICYGLTLSLTEQEAVKSCVNVYCEWLSALTIPKHTIPTPLLKDPNFFVQKILRHLINLFLPRMQPRMQGMNMHETTTQVMLCHRVLRTIQTVATESIVMTRQTWESLLKFLLAANDIILAPPLEPGALSMVPIPDSLAEQLCERLLSVLFEIWLLACGRCFPSPTLWRTLTDMCATWRHHAATVEQWNRINKVLTSRLLKILYGPEFPTLFIADEEAHIIPTELDNDGIAQTWFRFLHLLGNPVDLCRPKVISHTPKFRSAAVTYQPSLEPHQFTCLQALPQIFLKAMRGVSVVIDAFLGISTHQSADPHTTRTPTLPPGDTPPPSRKISRKEQISTKQFKEKLTSSHHPPPLSSQSSSQTTMSFCVEDATDGRGSPTPRRSQCNSILHLFGAWLFEAALTGCKSRCKILPPPRRRSLAVDARTNTTNFALGKAFKRHHSIAIPDSARSAHLSDLRSVSLQDPFSASVAANPLFDMSEFPDNYEAGRAEACGMLCRIFTSRKSDEEIQQAYLGRFYVAFSQGVRVDEALSGQVLSSVLYNSTNLLRIDLKGVQVLIPDIITALQVVLPDKEIRFQSLVSNHQLRRASIHLLLSMLCLPHHFKNLPIQDLMTGKEMTTEDLLGRTELVTFQSLKPKLVDLMITAVQCETDSYNTQMLLGAMHFCVLDSAMCEEMEAKQAEMEQKDNILHEEDEEEELEAGNNEPEKLKRDSDFDEKRASSGSRTSSRSSVTGRTDSAWVIFVRCCHLVCQRLMSAWSTDYTVALAALELLAGLAKVKIKIIDSLECKRAVKWICDHIVYQCSRPSMYHSRDLHSIIVAAFHCLTVWLIEHGDLLKDKECLQCVLEVVELGISGTKSQRKASVAPVFKQDKELKPASKRVKDAAEGLLACLLNHVGSFPNPCGPASVGSLLDEQSLLKYSTDTSSRNTPHQPTFRYFVLENTTLMAVLERPVTENGGEILPTVTTVIRGPTGRHVWTMKLRHWSKKEKADTTSRLMYPMRPQPDDNVGTHHEITSRHYPEAVDKILLTQADQSIPSLEDIETDVLRSDHQKLERLIEEQTEYEKFVCETAQEDIKRGGYPNARTECKPPMPCREFGSARLILSHLGYLSLDSLKDPQNSPIPPAVVALDNDPANFASDLSALDAIPSRTYDTAFIFYVKAGQSNANDIIQNVTDRANVQPQFLEFLGSLGWPVDVHQHAGWTGNVTTSWKITFAEHKDNTAGPTKQDGDMSFASSTETHGGSLYNGDTHVLYYADVMSEIAFVVPSVRHHGKGRRHSADDGIDEPSKPAPMLTHKSTKSLPLSSRNLTLDLPSDTAPSTTPPQVSPMSSLERGRKSLHKRGPLLGPEIKVLIVWLESFDDREAFPLADLLEEMNTGLETLCQGGNSSAQVKSLAEPTVVLMFIHPLKSGLFRIHMHGRPTQAIPLVDGMVVSRRSLGTLVRQTAINACHRKRMETDSYSPPHVKRRQKIQDMANKYRSRLSVPEFYTALFADCRR
ncbi:ral GTPase-activating protein subunit beta-like isoform X2 [Patiria miniata]|uniref:Rap-GAP domain-containing protein n=1 Tax=Patiria miniata TaxID=46514 RepID=A0A914BFI1_PATMI|nr:ral GTPase-activating protein subunit beta-like isoform X2 [Patiria miniata]